RVFIDPEEERHLEGTFAERGEICLRPRVTEHLVDLQRSCDQQGLDLIDIAAVCDPQIDPGFRPGVGESLIGQDGVAEIRIRDYQQLVVESLYLGASEADILDIAYLSARKLDPVPDP